MGVRIIEDQLDGFRGDACLVVDDNGNYFVVSTITRAMFPHAYGDIETLAFRANEDGTVDEWMDVAGGGDMTRADVIAQIEAGDLNLWASDDDSYYDHDPDYLFEGDEEDPEFWSESVID